MRGLASPHPFSGATLGRLVRCLRPRNWLASKNYISNFLPILRLVFAPNCKVAVLNLNVWLKVSWFQSLVQKLL